MKRLIRFFTSLVLCVALVSPTLWGVSISPWGGYAMVGMEEVKAIMDAEREANEGQPGVDSVTQEDFTGGVIVGLDLGMLRAAQIMSGASKVTVDMGGIGATMSIENSLTMAMIGYRTPAPSKSTISLGIFAGMGMLTGSTEINILPVIFISIPHGGQGVVAEATVKYKSGILELNIGYRYAPITDVKTTETVGLLEEGTVVPNLAGDPLTVDFSGLMVSLGVRIGPGPDRPMYEED